ncbi:hypothetical protein PAXRUDRAFT_130523, partial [Paxillus rubicundulus Ve08.2h10]
REKIHTVPSWHGGPARYDCVFVGTDDSVEGMLSMEVACIFCFFMFVFTNSETYTIRKMHHDHTMDYIFFTISLMTCALVHWFDHIADEPDELTGMWMVRPSFLNDGSQNLAVVHVDSIVHSTHLLPIFGHEYIPEHVNHLNSLDLYRGFYVNRFADHHTFELAS